MTRIFARLALALLMVGAAVLTQPGHAVACGPLQTNCPPKAEFDPSAVLVGLSQEMAGSLVAPDVVIPDYGWRLRHPCTISDETRGACSAMDFRPCPEPPGRVIRYLVLEKQPLVRADGTVVDDIVPPSNAQPRDPAGPWEEQRQGCFDITPLNPPPSPGEVFSYFQRLPLPALTTQHQPPGDGLSGLPVIFYTDSPTTQTFTVDIRGFSVVIEAKATRYTWHTGDPATPEVTSTDPGKPYPNETIEHDYRSGTYTAYLTVTWGATFTVNGSAPANVPGTTTTDGPPVTFDVLQARPVLTNPYN